MPLKPSLGIALLAAALAHPCPAPAQLERLLEAPVVDGKDVVWVPTPDTAVDRMLALARVGPRDLVVDLGSGDGKIVIAAARRFGARGLGIEYSSDLIDVSRRAARADGVADRVRFVQADLFEADFREATVVTLYLLTSLNLKLRPKLLEMKPGTRVVSHVFRMGDWEPDETERIGPSDLYLWFVPAKVAGRWRVSGAGDRDFDLALEQRHQRLSGRVFVDGRERPLQDTRLQGDQIRFTYGDASGVRQVLAGRVAGDRIEGADGRWKAMRIKAN
jgi:SAM-dependent methyltransferase